MTSHVCVTCGTRFPPSQEPAPHCPVCTDERQYVGHDGQQWVTPEELARTHRNTFHDVDPGVTGIATEPGFAIGQQAHLIETPAGNLLWDCISLVDEPTIAAVERRGGLAAIAISHPHFYAAMTEWSHAFGNVPIYLHQDDRAWVMDPDPAIRFWTGERREPLPGSGVTLIRCGGHFPGSAVVHWPAGADGRGALFTADTITVVSDRRWVSFMYSYPNLIPLDPASVRRIEAAVEPYPFDRIYGGWRGRIVASDAKGAVRRAADRYIAHLQSPLRPESNRTLI